MGPEARVSASGGLQEGDCWAQRAMAAQRNCILWACSWSETEEPQGGLVRDDSEPLLDSSVGTVAQWAGVVCVGQGAAAGHECAGQHEPQGQSLLKTCRIKVERRIWEPKAWGVKGFVSSAQVLWAAALTHLPQPEMCLSPQARQQFSVGRCWHWRPPAPQWA